MASFKGYWPAIIISVGLHLLLVLAVTIGWQSPSDTKKTYTPRYVEAKLVQLKATNNKPKAVAKPKPNKIDLTAKRREQERRRKQQAEKQRKIDIAKKKKAEQAKKEKARQEKLAKEQERKRQELARQQQLQQELDQALLDEEEFLVAETQSEIAQSYAALIAQRVEQNWSRPPSARRGMTCVLELHLVPTGKVIDVAVIDGSGNAAFDRSAEQAVKRVERFEELQGMDPAVFEKNFRKFRMKFNPQDLRL